MNNESWKYHPQVSLKYIKEGEFKDWLLATGRNYAPPHCGARTYTLIYKHTLSLRWLCLSLFHQSSLKPPENSGSCMRWQVRREGGSNRPNSGNDLLHRQSSVIPRFAQRGREETLRRLTDWTLSAFGMSHLSCSVRPPACPFSLRSLPSLRNPTQPHLQLLSKHLAMWSKGSHSTFH